MESQVGEFLTPILEEEGPDDMLFQQDGAPPHFQKEVTDFLNRKCPEKWINRGGPITWPPRSPDLTPLEFFFFIGGYIKDPVYVPPLATTLSELAGRIRDRLQLPSTCLTTFGMKLITDISAGPITVPSLNICKM
jgi:hypothetical protein